MSMAAFRAELRSAMRDARQPADTAARPMLPRPQRETPAIGAAPARPAQRTVVQLWLPLTPLFALLAPFALLVSPLIALSPEMRRVNPLRAAWAIGGVLLALSGTVVDVDTPDAVVRIRIY